MHEQIINMIIEHGNIDQIPQTCRQNNQSKLTMQSNRNESILEQQRKMDIVSHTAKMEAVFNFCYGYGKGGVKWERANNWFSLNIFYCINIIIQMVQTQVVTFY